MRYVYKITFHVIIPGQKTLEIKGGWETSVEVTTLTDFILRSELAANLNESSLTGVLPEHISIVACSLEKDRGVQVNRGDLFNYKMVEIP